MKKLVLLTALFGAVACSYGQGLINFANQSTTAIHITGGSYGSNAPALPANVAGSNPFMFGLFIAPGGTAAPTGLHDANWQFVGSYSGNSTSTSAAAAGRLQGVSPATIAGYAAGSTVNLLVRGWSLNVGNTWSEVLTTLDAPGTWTPAMFYGESNIGINNILGGGILATPTAMGLGSSQAQGFTVASLAIPEPATFALAGLGAAAMLIFRRRK